MADHRQTILTQLRNLLTLKGWQALVFTGTDPHESEYLADHWQVRPFLTGFTGSAGIVAVTADRAGLWTDSRYWLQAEKELAGSGYDLYKDGQDLSLGAWLGSALPPGAVVAVEARTCSLARYRRWQGETVNLTWVGTEDPLKDLWPDRPVLPGAPVWDYQETLLAGDEPLGLETRGTKIARLREKARRLGADSLLITALDEAAWTLNLRGSDVDFNPVFHSWLHIGPEKTHLFLAPGKLSPELEDRLAADGIETQDYQALTADWIDRHSGKTLAVGTDTLNWALWKDLKALETAGRLKLLEGAPSLAAGLKTRKTERELALIRRAMDLDGVALVRFLSWFDGEKAQPKEPEVWTEAGLASRLEEFRRKASTYRGPSFSPIAGFQAHGAVVHYSAEGPGAPVRDQGLLLLDTGAQYLEGTTDITRTLAVGAVGNQEKEDYTLVLKAHIRAALVRFPRGTRGYSIDAQARAVLWNRGLSYGHGTGHGVGHFLCVHEGPVRLNTEPLPYPLETGMVLSNEPGLYRPGQWGIRLENLQAVEEKETTPYGTFLGWETLTLCPFSRELIEVGLLDPEERTWLNAYHALVEARLGKLMEKEGKDLKAESWLREACAPL